MSAFVVSSALMNNVVGAICAPHKYQSPRNPRLFGGIDTTTPEGCTAIGRALFAMNIEAVMQCYPDCRAEPDRLPGDDINRADEYSFPASLDYPTLAALRDKITCFKALQCLHYQCSEGNVPETALYRELEKYIGTFAEQIVEALPEYDAVRWG